MNNKNGASDFFQTLFGLIILIIAVITAGPKLFRMFTGADAVSHNTVESHIVDTLQSENDAYFKAENGDNIFINKITNKFDHEFNGIVITSFYSSDEIIAQTYNKIIGFGPGDTLEYKANIGNTDYRRIDYFKQFHVSIVDEKMQFIPALCQYRVGGTLYNQFAVYNGTDNEYSGMLCLTFLDEHGNEVISVQTTVSNVKPKELKVISIEADRRINTSTIDRVKGQYTI